MLYFNYNGKMFLEDTAITGPDNRGLRYGDGLFETIKYKNGQLVLLDEHLARLWKGMQLMQFQPSKLFSPDLIETAIIQLLKKNNHTDARVRLSVIRGNGGLYDAKNHSPHYIIQSWPLEEKNNALNENGLQLCIYEDAKKVVDRFSNLKHNNYLPYFMGALFAKQQRCNDAIILNSFNRVADTCIANIFLVKDGSIYTPSTAEGCVAGIMRNFIMQQLVHHGYDITETAITVETLLEADEIFLTNSMYNLRWVAGIVDKKYSSQLTQKIYQLLGQTNPLVFC
ncbi:MAG: aminotransferase class IV [Ferruginibacter sp.]